MRIFAPAVLGFVLLVPGLATAGEPAGVPTDRTPASIESERVLKIVNKTKSFLLELYTSPADAKAWGADQLGNMRIAVGGNVTVNLRNEAGACLFDLMMVFSDGEKVIRRADVCQANSGGTMTITEHEDDPLPSA